MLSVELWTFFDEEQSMKRIAGYLLLGVMLAALALLVISPTLS